MFKKKIEQQKSNSGFIKECSLRLKYYLEIYELDSELKKKLENVYDVIHSSPVNSHITLRGLEMDMLSDINALDEMIKNNCITQAVHTVDRIIENIKERNLQLKLFN